MRDGASVNNVALRVFKVIYPNIMDVRCFSHTLDIVGNKFKTPLLATFSSYWISLFSYSPRTKMLWKDYTGQAMASYSKTRWWSKWEIFHQLMVHFGDLEPFLSAHPEIGPSLKLKLLGILHGPNQLGQLKMEVAAVVDVGEHFVKTTYRLEGYGALMVNCCEEIAKLRAVLSLTSFPNIQAIAESLAPGNLLGQQQLTTYAFSCVKPGVDYFMEKFGDESKTPLNQFKAMWHFSPSRIFELQPSLSDIEALCSIPFFNKPLIVKLKAELPNYIARSTDVNPPKFCSGGKTMKLLCPTGLQQQKKYS